MTLYAVVSDVSRNDLGNLFSVHMSEDKAREVADDLNEKCSTFVRYDVYEIRVVEDGEEE